MKFFLGVASIILFYNINVLGQFLSYSEFSKNNLYTVKISFADKNQKPVKAFLYNTTDSSILITSSIDETEYIYDKVPLNEYPITNIEKLKIKRYRAGINKGLKIGGYAAAANGGLTLFMFALAGNSKEVGSPFLYGIAAGIISFVPGFITGYLVENSSEKIPINGSLSQYSAYRLRINNYGYKSRYKP